MIGEWSARTKPATTPVIHFLKTIRDLALHEGKLRSYATKAEIHRNEVIIETGYDVGRYDEQGDRHDLLAELHVGFRLAGGRAGADRGQAPRRLAVELHGGLAVEQADARWQASRKYTE